MMDESSYWNSDIDDFVLQDIPAFINKIVEIKTRELYDLHREKNPHLGTDDNAIKEDILKNLKRILKIGKNILKFQIHTIYQ